MTAISHTLTTVNHVQIVVYTGTVSDLMTAMYNNLESVYAQRFLAELTQGRVQRRRGTGVIQVARITELDDPDLDRYGFRFAGREASWWWVVALKDKIRADTKRIQQMRTIMQ